MELEHDLPRIKAQGFGLAAISYDSVGILKNFAERRGITFPLLSDPESKIIQSFGILNESAPKNTPFSGIPYPGTYLLDPKGVVVSKYFVDDFRERDTAGEILVKQFGIRTEEVSATTFRTYGKNNRKPLSTKKYTNENPKTFVFHTSAVCFE